MVKDLFEFEFWLYPLIRTKPFCFLLSSAMDFGYSKVDRFPLKSNEKEVEVKDKIPTVNGFDIIEDYKLNLQVEIPVSYDRFEIYINDAVYDSYTNPVVGSANYDILVEESGVYNAYIIGYMF